MVTGKTMTKMDAAHEAHLQRILKEFTADFRAKYEAGQAEHGGQLWEKKVMSEIKAELLDMVGYVYTAFEQIERFGRPK